MKKILLIGMVLALAVPGLALADVQTMSGTMNVGAKMKVLYRYVAEDANSGVAEYSGVSTTWAELDFTGTVGENVTYVIELSYGGPWIDGDAGSNVSFFGGMGVRQAYIAISDVIPMSQLVMGTMMMPLGNYGQRPMNDLDMINYPLINDGANLLNNPGGSMGYRHTTTDMALWQQTGIGVIVTPMDILSISYGIMNGQGLLLVNNEANRQNLVQPGMIVWDDDVPGGDLHDNMFAQGIGASVTPGNMAFTLAYWVDPIAVDLNMDGHAQSRTMQLIGVSGSYITDKIDLTADFVQRTIDDLVLDDDGDAEDWVSMGWQITFGYWITDSIEGLIRYDWIDPNLQNDEDCLSFPVIDPVTGAIIGASMDSENDIDQWWTLGMNYRLNENAEVSINYIIKIEEGDEFDADDATPDIDDQQQANDEVLVQVQVWQ